MVVEQAPATPAAKRRSRSKSLKKVTKLTPFEERLKDSDAYTKPRLDDFSRCGNIKERLLLVNSLLSDDVTDISRAWPMRLKTKDSRLRRELSGQGKDAFLRGDYPASLQYYNEALMYSSGKGIAHTLAMRAAFFLATDDHALAVRDLSIALEYGCLETELLDFLMVVHTEDEEKARTQDQDKIDTAVETMRNAKFEMKNASAGDISKWADDIRDNLSKALKLKRNTPSSKKIKDDILKNIIASIRKASEESNLDDNLEIQELEVPKMKDRNPLCPAFSEAARIAADPDKGRKVVARRDIKAGEMICVDDPVCSMLCPDDKKGVTSHCTACFRHTRAPLPCDTCCSVVFCSKKCKLSAVQGFHKYECQLKLYEMFEFEKPEIFSLFMALRAITQKPLQYFTENQKEVEAFLELDEPKFPFPGRAYNSEDYRALANLMTHVNDLEETVLLKNSVLSVFFLRFLKTAGYFGRIPEAPRGKPKDPSPSSLDIFILRLIHQIVCAQVYNAQPVHKITKAFSWEKVGMAINPSLALVNHSCDSNAVRCSVNKSSILVAACHIPEGQEITESYTVHFRNNCLDERQYHTLKNYMFACECHACKGNPDPTITERGNWPQEGEFREKPGFGVLDEIPEALFAIPSVQQEKVYKTSYGDKKDIVKKILGERKIAEKWMTQKRFSNALEAYQDLCESLEYYIRRPHAFFLQARTGISHCIWNLYCTQFPEQPLEESDDSDRLREMAKEIYRNALTEEIPVEYEVEIPEGAEGKDAVEMTEEETEKAALLEATRRMVDKSTKSVAEARAGAQALKNDSEEAKQADLAMQAASAETINGQTSQEELPPISPNKCVLETAMKVCTELKGEEKEKNAAKDKEQEERLSRRKQWEAEDKDRMERELARKKKREKETQNKIKQANEKEKMVRERKKAEEEEKIRRREEDFKKMQQQESEKREQLARSNQLKKRQEEDELALLLAEIGDSLEPNDSDLEQLEADHGKPPFKNERDMETVTNEALGRTNRTHASNTLLNGNKEPGTESNDTFMSDLALTPSHDTLATQDTIQSVTKSNNENVQQTINGLLPVLSDNKPRSEEPDNVWATLRKIKENQSGLDLTMTKPKPKGETLSIDDFDSLLKNLHLMVKKDVAVAKDPENSVEEEDICDTDLKESVLVEANGDVEHPTPAEDIQEFNYDAWKAEIDILFGAPGERKSFVLEKDEADEVFLQNLKSKIAVSVEKQKKEIKKTEKERRMDEKHAGAAIVTPPEPRKVDDFALLKLKEKERKKRKRDDKFQQQMSESCDKLKYMSLKAAKIEKISTETESEIQKLREKSKLLVSKSAAKENEFIEMFKDIENIDMMSLDSDTKKSKLNAQARATEIVALCAQKNELHWTEEDRGKWNSSKTKGTPITEMLSNMRAMACQGNTSVVLDSLKTTISHCQKVDEESKADGQKIKVEKQKQVEALKQKKDLENKAIKEKRLVKNYLTVQEKIEVRSVTQCKTLTQECNISSLHNTMDAELEEEEDRQILEMEKKLELRKKEEEKLLANLSSKTAEEEMEDEEDKKVLDMERKHQERKLEEEMLQADILKEQEDMQLLNMREKVEEAKRDASEKEKIMGEAKLRKIKEAEEKQAKDIAEMKKKYEKEEEKAMMIKRKLEEKKREDALQKQKSHEEENKKLEKEQKALQEKAKKKRQIENEQKIKQQEEEKKKLQKEEEKRKSELKMKRQLEDEEKLDKIEQTKKSLEKEKNILDIKLNCKKKEAEEKLRIEFEDKEKQTRRKEEKQLQKKAFLQGLSKAVQSSKHLSSEQILVEESKLEHAENKKKIALEIKIELREKNEAKSFIEDEKKRLSGLMWFEEERKKLEDEERQKKDALQHIDEESTLKDVQVEERSDRWQKEAVMGKEKTEKLNSMVSPKKEEENVIEEMAKQVEKTSFRQEGKLFIEKADKSVEQKAQAQESREKEHTALKHKEEKSKAEAEIRRMVQKQEEESKRKEDLQPKLIIQKDFEEIQKQDISEETHKLIFPTEKEEAQIAPDTRQGEKKEKQEEIKKKKLEEEQNQIKEDEEKIQFASKQLVKEMNRIEAVAENNIKTLKHFEEEKKRIEDEAEESLNQIMLVKKKLNEENKPTNDKERKTDTKHGKVIAVTPTSFMPQKNMKQEIGVIKIGSPSQIRRTIKQDAKMEEIQSSCSAEVTQVVGNYQIVRVPTASFEMKKPPAKSVKEQKYSITKVPTSTVVLEQMTKTYADNIAKYSETQPTDTRKRSTSTPRPPPPSFKPPPPPPVF